LLGILVVKDTEPNNGLVFYHKIEIFSLSVTTQHFYCIMMNGIW